jgi:hypothetical protein
MLSQPVGPVRGSMLTTPLAPISIQMVSHADTLSLQINHIWLLNQNAWAVSPSHEANAVLMNYQQDIQMLMAHIENFRLKTQQIVAYTHSIPALLFPQ